MVRGILTSTGCIGFLAFLWAVVVTLALLIYWYTWPTLLIGGGLALVGLSRRQRRKLEHREALRRRASPPEEL